MSPFRESRLEVRSFRIKELLAGIVYHREEIMGDYDEFDDLEELT